MTREELTQFIEAIRTAENDVQRNELLLQLDEDYNSLLAVFETQAEQVAELTKENAEYVKQNNALWLKISGQKEQDEEEVQEEPEKLSYEELFKEED